MKAFSIATAIVLVALGVIAGSVFWLGDDEILVSPPAVVAEEFVRAIAHGQTGAAWRMLTRRAEGATSNADVRRLVAGFESRFGHLEEVHGTVAERKDDSVFVRTRIEGTRTTAETVLVLIREYGEWSVAHPSDVVGDTADASHTR
jgi:hypothetical protein